MKTDLSIEQRIANEKKSVIVAYALWFFLGMFGAHRMYLGRWGSAFAMLALSLIGGALTVILVGYIALTIVAIWWVFDLFLTQVMINADVDELRSRLTTR